MITEVEKSYFIKLLNRGGYVLDFSTSDFDAFTLESVGVPLCKQYSLSKGKSLEAFLYEADSDSCLKLLSDLLDYYESEYRAEYTLEEKDGFLPYGQKHNMRGTYLKCREIVDREKPSSSNGISSSVSYIKEQFSSEYINKQIDLLVQMRTENPTEAIGKSKELIESCCKTILEELGISYSSDESTPQLVKKVMKELDITNDNVSNDMPEGQVVKQILGSLSGLATGIAQFRNSWGSGHGKSASYSPLPVRHAKLAVGSSITLVEYLWEAYEWRKKEHQ